MNDNVYANTIKVKKWQVDLKTAFLNTTFLAIRYLIEEKSAATECLVIILHSL